MKKSLTVLFSLCMLMLFMPQAMAWVKTPQGAPIEIVQEKKEVATSTTIATHKKLPWKARLAMRIANKRLAKMKAMQTASGKQKEAVISFWGGLSAMLLTLITLLVPTQFLFLLLLLVSLASIVFGIVGLIKIGQLPDKKNKGRGMAIIGMLLALIFGGFWVLLALTVGG